MDRTSYSSQSMRAVQSTGFPIACAFVLFFYISYAANFPLRVMRLDPPHHHSGLPHMVRFHQMNSPDQRSDDVLSALQLLGATSGSVFQKLADSFASERKVWLNSRENLAFVIYSQTARDDQEVDTVVRLPRHRYSARDVSDISHRNRLWVLLCTPLQSDSERPHVVTVNKGHASADSISRSWSSGGSSHSPTHHEVQDTNRRIEHFQTELQIVNDEAVGCSHALQVCPRTQRKQESYCMDVQRRVAECHVRKAHHSRKTVDLSRTSDNEPRPMPLIEGLPHTSCWCRE